MMKLIAAAMMLAFSATAVFAAPAAEPAKGKTAVKPAAVKAEPAKPTAGKAEPGQPAQPAAGKLALININTATEAELRTIPGVGAAYAAAIIKGRPYDRKDQLAGRKVLPAGVYNKIKDKIIASK